MKPITIVYGKKTKIISNAVKILTETLLDFCGTLPTVESCEAFKRNPERQYIFIGTKNENPFIKENSNAHLTIPEEYKITVGSDIFIEGFDEAGVLYGCVDFYEKYLMKSELTHDHADYFKNIFESPLPCFEYQSAPDIKERGLWTWGHVIYDYKGYIDNMMKLKMNTLIIWNDCVPYNAEEMIEYAHNANIKIYWGFPWGWDTNCAELDLKSIMSKSDEIAEYYEKNYADLNGDGIYFQSFTEVKTDKIGDISVAEAVTDFVNKTAEKIFEKNPDLELQFGLHATSVKNKLENIKNTNPKIRIVWEDCGAFPFDYIPKNIENFEEMLDFTKKISVLRGKNDKFGVVLKGFTCLDWGEFKHLNGSVNLGFSSKAKKAELTERKHKIWKYVQAYWLKNASFAYEAIKAMKAEKNGDLCVTALVEDSMFENKIYYPVALYSQMLWDTKEDISDLMCDTALKSYVEFA